MIVGIYIFEIFWNMFVRLRMFIGYFFKTFENCDFFCLSQPTLKRQIWKNENSFVLQKFAVMSAPHILVLVTPSLTHLCTTFRIIFINERCSLPNKPKNLSSFLYPLSIIQNGDFRQKQILFGDYNSLSLDYRSAKVTFPTTHHSPQMCKKKI